MDYEIIAEKDAPKPPRPLSKSTQETVQMLNALKDGQVAKITLPEGKSVRGIKTGLGRVAKGQGINIQSWDDGTFVYVKKTK